MIWYHQVQVLLSTMNFGIGVRIGDEKVKVMLTDVLWFLDAIDELLQPSQPCKAPLAAREGTVVEFTRFDGTSDPLRWIYRCP
jgi:hypothetical protein